MNVVDSPGWIEFFLACPSGPLFKPVIEQRDKLSTFLTQDAGYQGLPGVNFFPQP